MKSNAVMVSFVKSSVNWPVTEAVAIDRVSESPGEIEGCKGVSLDPAWSCKHKKSHASQHRKDGLQGPTFLKSS
jgi:hypothetical protein